MNLVIVSSDQYPDGGAAVNRHMAYAKGLAETGHEITFVILSRQDRDNGEYKFQGVTYKCVSREGYDPNTISRLERNKSIKRGKSAILEIHETKKVNAIILLDTFGWDLIPFIKLAKKKGIKTLHERTEYPYLKTFRTLKDRLNFFVYSSYVLRKFDGIFIINEALKNYFNRLINYKVPIEIINMIVDNERFDSTSTNTDNKNKYIAYCGSLNSEKDGVDILVEAFCRILKAGKIPADIKLMLIGEYSSESSRNKLQNIIKEHNCFDNIIFTGQVDRTKMPDLLKGALSLVLSRPDSIQSEGGFPTKLGEYLATGKPVIVTDVGEIGLFLKDGDNAFVAKPGDINSFSGKISEVFANYPRALEIGRKGRILTENEFNYLKQAAKLARFIESL